MARRLALVGFALLVGVGCRVEDAPERPIDDHVALCCKAATGPLSFTGCRPSNRCRTSETIWLRGPVRCGAVEPSSCAGGRCCSLDSQLASPPDVRVEPTSVEFEVTTPPAEVEPAPIVPMPFDSP